MSPAPTQAYENYLEEDSLGHWYRTPASPDRPGQDTHRQEQIARDERFARQLAEEDHPRSTQYSQPSAPVLPVYSPDGLPEGAHPGLPLPREDEENPTGSNPERRRRKGQASPGGQASN